MANRTCPSCNRGFDGNTAFCPLCGSFVGNYDTEPQKNIITAKNVILTVAAFILLTAVLVFVFALDIFGLSHSGDNEQETNSRSISAVGYSSAGIYGEENT